MNTMTERKTKLSIQNLQTMKEFEIINPIESKSLFGGNGYSNDPNNNPNGPTYNGGTLNTVYIGGHGPSSGTFYGTNNTLNGGYAHDWNNHGGHNNGGYGGTSSGSGQWVNNDSGQGEGELPNHSSHICAQISGGDTCAIMALSYVANYFGATGLTASDFAEMAGKSFVQMVAGAQGGLTTSELNNIVSDIFQSVEISSYQEIDTNLNSGHPVIATINQGGYGHEVVITSINLKNGDVSYMDPLTGGPVTNNLVSSTNPITFVGSMHAISGIQNNTTVNQYKNDTNDIKCGICGH
jgi:hypothetical protein